MNIYIDIHDGYDETGQPTCAKLQVAMNTHCPRDGAALERREEGHQFLSMGEYDDDFHEERWCPVCGYTEDERVVNQNRRQAIEDGLLQPEPYQLNPDRVQAIPF